MRAHGATLVSVFVLVGAVLIAACAKPYHEENERYVFVATNINLPYWQEAQAGFLDAAKALGVKGELIGPTGYAPNAELGMFRQIVEQHPPESASPRRGPRFSRRTLTRLWPRASR